MIQHTAKYYVVKSPQLVMQYYLATILNMYGNLLGKKGECDVYLEDIVSIGLNVCVKGQSVTNHNENWNTLIILLTQTIILLTQTYKMI